MAEEKKSSWLSSWGGGLLGSALGGLFGIGQQLIGNNYNRKEAQKNRDFQSQEAELNRIFQSNEAAMQRDWSSQEAERARDWQEEMNYKYNSIAGKIAQAEEAGVNPMFAISGNAVSPASASTSAPSGASAGSVGTPSGSTASASFVDIVGSILGMAKLKSEIENTQADTEQKKSETEGQKITNEQLRDMNAATILEKLSNVEMNQENVKLISSKILNTHADTDVKSAQLSQIASQIKNMDADTDVKVKQLAVLTSEIVKNYKSVDEMSASIAKMASDAGLNRAKAAELSQTIRNMVQDYNHKDVIYGLEEAMTSNEKALSDYFSVDNPNHSGLVNSIKKIYHILEGLVDFSAGVGVNVKK